ncbi:MAG: nucleotidyl transferase AbiEii/AbiGii toxin family protein [Bacteroidota bacterium]
MFDFLRIVVRFFDENKIPYMLSGGMAISIYTGPRYTRDFDFIVHLKPSDVLLLKEYFKDGYYCDEDAMKDAIRTKGMFNIIDHKSNYKADFIILKDDEFEQVEFEKRQSARFLDFTVVIVSPENLLISKLRWIQEMKSAQQSSDIVQLSKLENLDWPYIQRWVEKLKLNTFDLLKND